MIQSPLLTSLMALCIFSLFSLVMLGQRYTTPMVTVVCPVTNLHHMASLQSASSCNCTCSHKLCARQEVYHGQVKAISRSSDCQEFWRKLHLFD